MNFINFTNFQLYKLSTFYFTNSPLYKLFTFIIKIRFAISRLLLIKNDFSLKASRFY